jgi:broad-specificity NMP kinase
MKLFVLGVPCSGKSTICKLINSSYNIRAIDVDDEIVRLNNGAWPEMSHKNEVVIPRVMESLLSANEALVFHSFIDTNDLEALRAAGFTIALLAVSPEELLRRHDRRQSIEGWSNVEWFDWNQNAAAEFERSGLIDEVIDAERPVEAVASDIVALFGKTAPTADKPD